MTKDSKIIVCHPQTLMAQLSALEVDPDFARTWTSLGTGVQSAIVDLATTWCCLRVSNCPDLGSRTIPTLEVPTISQLTLMASVALSFEVRRLDEGYVLFPSQVQKHFEGKFKSTAWVMPANGMDETLRSAIALSSFLESKKRGVSS